MSVRRLATIGLIALLALLGLLVGWLIAALATGDPMPAEEPAIVVTAVPAQPNAPGSTPPPERGVSASPSATMPATTTTPSTEGPRTVQPAPPVRPSHSDDADDSDDRDDSDNRGDSDDRDEDD